MEEMAVVTEQGGNPRPLFDKITAMAGATAPFLATIDAAFKLAHL